MSKKNDKRTVTIEARSEKEAIKKLRARMLPEWKKKLVPEKVKLINTVKTYSVTWRPKKTKRKRKK